MLLAVLDVWDAPCSDRPNRREWSSGHALAHIRSLAGNHIDSLAVDISVVPTELGHAQQLAG